MGLNADLIIEIENKFGLYFDEIDSVWLKPDATFGGIVDEVRRLLAEKAASCPQICSITFFRPSCLML